MGQSSGALRVLHAANNSVRACFIFLKHLDFLFNMSDLGFRPFADVVARRGVFFQLKELLYLLERKSKVLSELRGGAHT